MNTILDVTHCMRTRDIIDIMTIMGERKSWFVKIMNIVDSIEIGDVIDFIAIMVMPVMITVMDIQDTNKIIDT